MDKILICNHKMFLTPDEALMLKENMDNLNINSDNLIICPNFLDFDTFSNYNLGAQNCFYEDKGSYTGEVSAYHLHLKGIKYCIVGHLERRNVESLKEINLKVHACLRNSITPIICIGESRLDKEMRRTSESLKKQLITILKDINLSSYQEIMIAYEPSWTIGTGNIVKKEDLSDTAKFIKKILLDLKISNYKLLYGGGITGNNIKELLIDGIDGYLIGSASTNINELKNIIDCIK